MAAKPWTFTIDVAATRDLAHLPTSVKNEALDLIEQMQEDPMDVVEPLPLDGYPRHFKVYFAAARYRMTVRIDQRRRHFELVVIALAWANFPNFKG